MGVRVAWLRSRSPPRKEKRALERGVFGVVACCCRRASRVRSGAAAASLSPRDGLPHASADTAVLLALRNISTTHGLTGRQPSTTSPEKRKRRRERKEEQFGHVKSEPPLMPDPVALSGGVVIRLAMAVAGSTVVALLCLMSRGDPG